MKPLLQYVDAVTVPVPDLDRGLAFYRDVLGHQLIWRNEATGQAGLRMSRSDTEVVLTTQQKYEPDWKVASADAAAEVFAANGGRVLVEPVDIPIGRLTVVEDLFGNRLVLLDSTKGTTTPTNQVRSPASRDAPALDPDRPLREWNQWAASGLVQRIDPGRCVGAWPTAGRVPVSRVWGGFVGLSRRSRRAPVGVRTPCCPVLAWFPGCCARVAKAGSPGGAADSANSSAARPGGTTGPGATVHGKRMAPGCPGGTRCALDKRAARCACASGLSRWRDMAR